MDNQENMQLIKDAAEKLIKLLREEYDPYTTIIIKQNEVKVAQDLMYMPLS